MARPQLWDRGKERTWRQRVARWRHSGLTARDFCAREGLSEPSFYAWRRTLRERDQQCGRARQAKHGGTPPRVQPETPALVPVRLSPAATAVVDAGWAIEV